MSGPDSLRPVSSHSDLPPCGLRLFCLEGPLWPGFYAAPMGEERWRRRRWLSADPELAAAAAEESEVDVASHFPFGFNPLGDEESHLQEHRHACLFNPPVSSWHPRSGP